MTNSDQPTNQKPAHSGPLPLGVVFLTVFIDLAGFSIIFPLFPAMLEYYLEISRESWLLISLLGFLDQISEWSGLGSHFTPVLFGGFLGSLYAFLQFIFAPVWGSLSDRFGRRKILLITVTGTALSYVLWFFSGTFGLLILARLFGGAMSGNLSVASAAVADITRQRERASGMGLLGVAFGLGFVTGPAIGGGFSLLDLRDWPLLASLPGVNPFSAAAGAAFLLSMINLIWIWFRFRETVPESSLREARSQPLAIHPLARLKVPLSAPVKEVTRVYFFFIFSFSGMEFTLTFLAVERFGFSVLQITQMLVFIGVVLILTQGILVRRFVPRVGERKTALFGLSAIFTGFLFLAWAPDPFWLYVGLASFSIGAGLTTPSLTALVSFRAEQNEQGRVLGYFRSLGSLARATGPLAAGVLYWWTGSATAYLTGAILILAAVVLCSRLRQ